MAEAIAFDIAGGLASKLSSLALSQIGLWWNFKDDIEDLKNTISTIKGVLLDAEEQSMTSNLVKNWLEKLKDALYDADDLLDDFSTEALRKDLLSGNKLTKEVRLFFSSSNQFVYGLKMGRQIKAIKARLTSIGSEAKMFNLVERDSLVEPSFMSKKRQRTHSFMHKDEIIGREDDKAALPKLMLGFQSEENVCIIPIVGFGGLGKTALAQFVYEIVKDHFEMRIWVCVSNIFDLKIIVKNIIKSKKYLLVSDDIWNEEWEQWVSLKKLLMGGAKGSRIIVTTRSLRVAKITSKCQPHVLKGLSDDDAWSLFKEIAFEQRSTDSTSLEFVEIGKQILERCGGVPLVIRTIAGKLSFKNSKNDWLSFKDNELARISQNGGEILPTLKLSYDHLPYHLKHCFAYCRLYPKDHKIDVRTLVQFWIAQGFVKQSSPSQSLEEIGLGYFKDLVERSFFQEVEDDETWFTTCKMHDLMHDLAELVAGTESSFIDSNSSASEVSEKCRHVSISPLLIPLLKGKKFRTLLCFPKESEQSQIMIPRSIHKLKHLRYLDLSDNPNIKILPKSICNMQNLQALKLDWCVGLEELPKKIAKLVNLSHIGCVHCYGLTHMPRGIGKLTSLEMLSRFVVDKDGSQGGADLSELSGLINLKGELIISNLGFVKNAKEMFRAANLKEKQHLEAFVLEWGDDNNDDDKSLEVLQPHPNLKMLKVGGWRGNAKFPSWLSLLTKLVDITIWGPSNFKHLPSFAQLPCLQQLKISNLTELQCMEDHGPNGRHGDTESFFPSLKVLRLWNCPNMKSWWRTTQHPRPLKQTIKMSITSTTPSTSTSSLPLSKLKSFHAENIEGLDTHMLDDCLQNMTSLERCFIDSCHLLESLSGWQQHLIGLKTLIIKDCKEATASTVIDNIPKLVSLPIGLQHLVQLESLEIRNCSGLRSLFPVFQHLTSLEEFSIRNCNELELSAAGMQIFQDYKSLRALWLETVPKCQHLPEWLQHLTNLQQLYLVDFPNLTSLPDEIRCLTSLEELCIRQTPQLEERCRKDIGADWHKIAHIATVTIEDF
ncbi:hypothetical protein V6Z11_A11G376000 [Gossypium hirsutum]